ncbi:MAG: hypothetical protein ACHREM_17710 [Polyangiales bacterium]
MIPTDPDGARERRLRDRLFELYVNAQAHRVVGDRLRPEGRRDAFSVAQAKAQIEASYAIAYD